MAAVQAESQGVVSTVAGNGTAGYNGDGQLGTMAELNTSSGIGAAVDHASNLYIADDDNQRIRRVDAITHRITTIAGNGQKGYDGDNGQATAARLNNPNAIVVADDGTLYIADTDNEVVRRVDPRTHIITTIAGIPGQQGFQGDGGLATRAQMRGPVALALTNNDTTLYVADLDNHVVRAINLQSHHITTVAGIINMGSRIEGRDFKGDGGPATRALLAGVYGLAVDQRGNLYIADTNNGVIRRVDVHTHIITTVAGHYAGTFAAGYSGDGGAATSAQFNNPTGLAIAGDNNLYIADGGNHVIRRVDLRTSIITTVVGSGVAGDSGDGQSARQAAFQTPRSLYLAADGKLYIGDMKANRIRIVQMPTQPQPIKAGAQYTITATTGATIVPGSHDTGNRCDECMTRINLPFRYKFYNRIVTTAYASANGQLDFTTPGDRSYDSSGGLPDRLASDAIFPYWGDLTTAGSGGGVFTSLSTEPRTGKPIFNIEWRARYVDSGNPVNFEIRLYASAPRFDVVYGRGDEGGSFATVGVQQGFGTNFTLYETYTPYSLAPRIALHFALNNAVLPVATAHNILATSRTPNKSSATATSSLTNSSKNQSILAHLHMPRTHHLQAAGKLIQLHVYVSPVGLPIRSRLSMRNIRSVQAFNYRTTAGGPFDLPISIAHYAVRPHRTHNVLPDSATSIYGVSGDFADCQKSYANPVTCSNGHLSYSAAFGNQNTGNPTDAGTDGLGASLIRFQSFLPCTPSTLIPADKWNNTFTALKEAYSKHLIPIVNFLPPNYVPPRKLGQTLISPGCPTTPIAPETWYNDVSSFAATLYSLQLTPQSGIPKTLPPTYFEIGNEPNDGKPSTEKRYGEPNGVSAGNYPNDFAQAARALTDELQSDRSGTSYPFYRILTAGVVKPTALYGAEGQKMCGRGTKINNYAVMDTFAGAAIKAAKNIGVTHNLGVAVHPYGYVTQPDGQDWKNYIGLGQTPSGVVIKPGLGGRTYGSPCSNLEAMNRTWTSHFPGLPLVYTEINSSSGLGPHGDSTEKQGTYLIDLFSYMYRHHKSAVMHPSTDVYRIAWYRGGDQGITAADRGADLHGIYTVTYGKGTAGYLAGDKDIFGSIRCGLDNISNIGNVSTMSNDFFFLRHAMC